MKDYLDDNRLSWKARGIMAYLLRHPDTAASERVLADLSSEGVTAVRAALNELVKLGYITRSKIRKADGKFQWRYSIQPCLGEPCAENPSMDNPIVVVNDLNGTNSIDKETTTMQYPSMENPSMENLSMVNKETHEQKLKRLTRVYENEIGGITKHISEKIEAALEQHGVDQVEEAMKTAAAANKRSWSYTEGILRNWNTNGRHRPPANAPQKKRPEKLIILDDDGTPLREVMVNV